jgi:hypothetical protein
VKLVKWILLVAAVNLPVILSPGLCSGIDVVLRSSKGGLAPERCSSISACSRDSMRGLNDKKLIRFRLPKAFYESKLTAIEQIPVHLAYRATKVAGGGRSSSSSTVAIEQKEEKFRNSTQILNRISC